jgi:hypothetical protein
MSWKDKLRDAQKTSGGDIPKLSVVKVLDMKEVDGKPAFRFWDKDAEESKFIVQPLIGVLIGQAFRCMVFDDTYGKHGGSYTSALYLSNSNITMYSPDGKSRYTGSKEMIEKWLIGEGVKDSIRVKKCLLFATKSGLIEVQTNTIIAIDQVKVIKPEDLINNKVILTPSMYNPEDPMISKVAKNYLGKFAGKNPPKYASITIGSPITAEDEVTLSIEEYADQFIKWKEWISKGNTIPEVTEEQVESAPVDRTQSDLYVKNMPSPSLANHGSPVVKESDDFMSGSTNDLPF